MKNVILIIVLFGISNKALSQINLEEGLQLYLPFNNSIADESPNNLEVLHHEATLGEDCEGQNLNALYFDGIDDYLTVKNSSNVDFELEQEYSISFWFKTQESATQLTSSDIISKWNSAHLDTAYSYTIRISTNFSNEPGIIKASRFDSDVQGCSNISSVSSENNYLDNDWHHVVYQMNSNSKILLSVDAELKDSIHDLSSCSLLSASDIILGDRTITNDGSRQPYTGALDEIRIYNRTLNKEEIEALFNKETSNLIETKENSRIKIFPNPTFNSLNIETSNPNSIIENQIFNSYGTHIFSSKSNNLSFNQTGIYFVKTLFRNGQSEINKIIVL